MSAPSECTDWLLGLEHMTATDDKPLPPIQKITRTWFREWQAHAWSLGLPPQTCRTCACSHTLSWETSKSARIYRCCTSNVNHNMQDDFVWNQRDEKNRVVLKHNVKNQIKKTEMQVWTVLKLQTNLDLRGEMKYWFMILNTAASVKAFHDSLNQHQHRIKGDLFKDKENKLLYCYLLLISNVLT